jgi:hypothetical protein
MATAPSLLPDETKQLQRKQAAAEALVSHSFNSDASHSKQHNRVLETRHQVWRHLQPLGSKHKVSIWKQHRVKQIPINVVKQKQALVDLFKTSKRMTEATICGRTSSKSTVKGRFRLWLSPE